jgi:hypothetical protein
MTNARRRPHLVIGLLVPALALAAATAHAETTQCTVITTVPYVITVQGVYCLNDDLKVGLASGNAIEITANNVVLDLNGHRLSNSGGPASFAAGVYASGNQNLTVKNGTVKGFYIGVDLNSVFESVVEHVRADQNLRAGIFANGQALVVRDNLVLLTGGTTALGPNSDSYGILVNGAWNGVLRNDVVIVTKQGSGFAYGLYVSGQGHFAVRNRISQADRAIYVDSPTGAKYRDSLASGTTLAPYAGGIDAGNNQ